MSQTDKLVSLTGLSRVLNTINNFIGNTISNISKKIMRIDVNDTIDLIEDLKVGTVALNPNEYTIIDNVNELDELRIAVPNTLTYTGASCSSNDYTCEFTTPSNKSVKITLPSNITKWRNGSIPTFKSGKTYVVSIMNGLGTISEYSFVGVAATEGEE